MLLAIALFAAGIAEYMLAAYWTRVVVARAVGRTAAVTFVNVMVWGFIVANIKIEEPLLLVIHGAGCALGASLVCAWGDAPPEEPVRAADPAGEEQVRVGHRVARRAAAGVEGS